jgi:hypothetical protein
VEEASSEHEDELDTTDVEEASGEHEDDLSMADVGGASGEHEDDAGAIDVEEASCEHDVSAHPGARVVGVRESKEKVRRAKLEVVAVEVCIGKKGREYSVPRFMATTEFVVGSRVLRGGIDSDVRAPEFEEGRARGGIEAVSWLVEWI